MYHHLPNLVFPAAYEIGRIIQVKKAHSSLLEANLKAHYTNIISI